jgi:hypothetical protein
MRPWITRGQQKKLTNIGLRREATPDDAAFAYTYVARAGVLNADCSFRWIDLYFYAPRTVAYA